MFTLSLVSRAKAGGGEDEAGFEDRVVGLVQDFCDLHYLFLSTKIEGHWRDQQVTTQISVILITFVFLFA